MIWVKAGGLILGLLLFVGSYFYTFNKGGDLREAEIKAQIAEFNAISTTEEKKEVADVARTLENSTDKILHASENDDGVIAPVLRRQLDRM